MIVNKYARSAQWIACACVAYACTVGCGSDPIDDVFPPANGPTSTFTTMATPLSPTSSASARAPAEILVAAKACLDKANMPVAQAEPAFAIDAGATWQLFFRWKERFEERDGQTVMVKQLPEFARVDVRKDSLAASIVPTR